MNRNMKKSSLAVALVCSGLMFSASQAHAEAYATAFTNITSLFVNVTPASNVTGFSAGSDTSVVTANLNLANAIQGGAGVIDPAPANAPGSSVARLNNAFNLFGPGANQTYSNSDAQIASRQSVGNPFTQILQIGESDLNTPFAAGSNTENSSLTGFRFSIVTSATTFMDFSFKASSFLRAMVDATNAHGTSAQATMNVVISLADAAGNIVFNWTPDGQAGGISGGAETSDPCSLNTNIGATFLPENNSKTCGNGVDATIGAAPASFLAYAASTNALAAGTYTLNLSSKNSTQVRAVPEPGALALLGIGLAGMGAVARRKKSA